MQPIKFQAGQYSQRVDLETAVRSQCGDVIATNQTDGHEIDGTIEELKSLGLSGSSTIYGVKCVISA